MDERDLSVRRVQGVVQGRTVILDRDIDLDPGARVELIIRPLPLTTEEKSEMIAQLCGAWRDDPSVEPLFKEIERAREGTRTRPVRFDAAP